MHMYSLDPILDDDALRQLLKLPEGVDLGHYRDRAGLPYLRFRHQGRTFHRYLTSEVLKWLSRRQHHGTVVASS